jgi:hypothetical protein
VPTAAGVLKQLAEVTLGLSVCMAVIRGNSMGVVAVATSDARGGAAFGVQWAM